MPLFLDDDDQARVITIPDAMATLESALKQLARGDAIRRPRFDSILPAASSDELFNFSTVEGGVREPGYYALRVKQRMMSPNRGIGVRRGIAQGSTPGLQGGFTLLYGIQDANLLAILTDDFLQHFRVAITAALGVQALSRSDARVLGMYGSGGMARSIAEAIATIRTIKEIRVHSPNPDHVEAFRAAISAKLGIPVVAPAIPREVARGADILCACTSSPTPVIQGDWIEPGMHVCNVAPWELDDEVYRRIDVAGLLVRRTPMSVADVVDDDLVVRLTGLSYLGGSAEERARIGIGYRQAAHLYPNARFVDCIDWRTGRRYERAGPAGTRDEITTLAHSSYGNLEGDAGPSASYQGIQFAAIGGRIYELARANGLGIQLPDELFLQDIPT